MSSSSSSSVYNVVNEEKNHDIYLIDMENPEETYFVCQLPTGIQDHTWIDETTLLLGSGAKLYVYDMFGTSQWEEVADLTAYNISEITRITISPDGKRIAFAAESN